MANEKQPPVEELPAEGMGILDGLGDVDQKSDMDKIIEFSLNPDNIYHFTELNSDEITGFSTLGVLADKYDIKIVKEWLKSNLLMRVSKARKGKGEFVKIVSRNPEQPQMQGQGSSGPWNFFRR